jgi:hypothetical protein
MADYVEVGELRTWYDERASGEPLMLLHPGGAGVDARALGPNLPAFAERFRVFTPERRAQPAGVPRAAVLRGIARRR